jgi:hypothetical protein
VWLVAGALGLVLGVLSSLVTIFAGPVWATGPEVHPTGLDLSAPLSVPFDLKNPSAVFQVNVLHQECSFRGMKASTLGEFQNMVIGRSYQNAVIDQLSSRPFSCGLQIPFQMISYVKMNVSVEYMTPFAGMRRYIYHSRTWTWSNSHWTERDMLQ